MNPDLLQELTAKLRSRRLDILATMAMLDESGRPVELDQTTQGRLSRMDAIAQQQMARASRAHLASELARIDAALDRIAGGTFGVCCRCGLPIQTERLHADTAAPLCLDCLEELAEERRRQGPPRA